MKWRAMIRGGRRLLWIIFIAVLLSVVTLSGCGADGSAKIPGTVAASTPSAPPRDATPVVKVPQASGKVTKETDGVMIDLPHTDQGYFMARYSGSKAQAKLQVTRKGEQTNTYVLTPQKFDAFPFSQGNGTYSFVVYEQIAGDQYVQIFETAYDVTMVDEKTPFLYANQYVNFTASSKAVAKGAELVQAARGELDAVNAICSYIIKNIKYDYDRAADVQSKALKVYLPDIDQVLAAQKGICFDYAALMAAMLRTQRIPTRLVIGYAGPLYHAWIDVYIHEVGWVNKIAYFDGKNWTLMDPTFAASGVTLSEFVGEGSDYNPVYRY